MQFRPECMNYECGSKKWKVLTFSSENIGKVDSNLNFGLDEKYSVKDSQEKIEYLRIMAPSLQMPEIEDCEL